jgi:hypothetical protein
VAPPGNKGASRQGPSRDLEIGAYSAEVEDVASQVAVESGEEKGNRDGIMSVLRPTVLEVRAMRTSTTMGNVTHVCGGGYHSALQGSLSPKHEDQQGDDYSSTNTETASCSGFNAEQVSYW